MLHDPFMHNPDLKTLMHSPDRKGQAATFVAELGTGLVPTHRELRPQELLQLGCNAPPTHPEAEVHLSMLGGALRHHSEAEAEAVFCQPLEEEDVDPDTGKWPVYML